jgi:succinyl-CoA synthetase beta subunit
MNIHEYQGKEILKKFGVSIQHGIVADTPDSAVAAAKELQSETGTKWFVIKSQIHAGGRGKGTIKETGSKGVVLAKSVSEVHDKVKAILGGTLVRHQTVQDVKVLNKVLIAEYVYYPGEKHTKEY